MNLPTRRFLTIALAGFACQGYSAITNKPIFRPDSRYTVVEPVPGGLSVHPEITSQRITNGGSHVFLKWNGFAGPYTVEEAAISDPGNWTTLLSAGNAKSVTVPLANEGQSLYRIVGGTPSWQGASSCAECHDTASRWKKTAHAKALTTLQQAGHGTDSSCLPCHTAGSGTGGFVDDASTPHLAGVQCENCHGPVSFPHNKTRHKVRLPVIAMSAKVCGGCHNGAPHPTYEEWNESSHAEVDEAIQAALTGSAAGTAVASANKCAPCHSGWVRVNMRQLFPKALVFNSKTWSRTWGAAAAETGTTCVVCHDQHGTRTFTDIVDGTQYTTQLHNPLASLANYSYKPNIAFAAQYNRNINICGQCHNMRGATPKDTASPPHPSPQYNILIGSGGVAGNSAPPQSEHRLNRRQCVSCHAHTSEEAMETGHSFEARIEACAVCHTDTSGPNSPMDRLLATQSEILNLMAQVKATLDTWAIDRAPRIDARFQNYGTRAWEYTSVGNLSAPGSGPPASLQAKIPQSIKDARFNLYLVYHDGSLGIHNKQYARHLLETAEARASRAP